jgi:hypothetical protein
LRPGWTGTIGLHMLARLSGLILVTAALLGSTAAVTFSEPIQVSRASAALRWLISATEKDPGDSVNYLLLFQFASHITRGTDLHPDLLSIVNARKRQIVIAADSPHPRTPSSLDAVIAAYADATVRAALRPGLSRSWISRQRDHRSDSSDRGAFSSDEVNRLMSAAMLEAMQIASRQQLQELVRRKRLGYSAGINGYYQHGDKSVFYFAAHVPFAFSRLATRDVDIAAVRPEMHLFTIATALADITGDNDLWPEIYLGRWLIEGCQPAMREHFEGLVDQQAADGSWTPSTQPESSRLHTTSVMYLALLAHLTCG